MSALVEFRNIKSSLSHLQVELLKRFSVCLPFAADISRANLRLYVPDGDDDVLLVTEICPCTISSHAVAEDVSTDPAEKRLVKETFRQGKPMTEWRGLETGTTGIRTYALTDFGGRTMAVVALSFRLVLPMEEYAQLLHGAGMVLLHGSKLAAAVYARLTTEDGVLIADRFHRIIFADEIVLHIYRTLGIGSLVGRNLFDPQLRRGIDKEITVRDHPWDREMQAGDRVLRERHLDFSEGGNAVGDIVILSDITELRQREQEARIQEALMQRIEALEDELETLKDSLETRKLLDRAKGILMKTHQLTEQESYRRLQRYAMMKRKTLKEVAESVLKAAQKTEQSINREEPHDDGT